MDPYIKIIEDEKLNIDGYTLVMGFPGMGFVGTIAARYLIDKLKMKKVAHFESNFVNPVLVIHEGEILSPSRIYADHSKKIAVIISEQAIPKLMTQMMANEIIDFAKKIKAKNVFAFEGIKAGTGHNIMYGLHSSENTKQLMDKYNIQEVKEGLTTGVSAFVLLKSKVDKDVEALSLLGDVHSVADYEAAAECIKKIGEILDFKVDTGPLMEEAKNTKKLLMTQLAKLKEENQKVQDIEDSAPMYT